VLVELYSWVDDRRIASILIWPSLEAEAEDAAYDQMQRVEQIKDVVLRGATDMAWSMRLEVDYGLEWDHERNVWVASDGFAYDGARATDNRQPSGQDQEPGRGHQSGAVLLPLGRPVPKENGEAS
jgi:hypothetical protein